MIRYLPLLFLKRAAPDRLLKRLVTQRLTLRRAVLESLRDAEEILGRRELERIALRVIKGYRESYGELRDDGIPVGEAKDEVLNDARLMISRVQNAVVTEVTERVREKYRGERYRWLPSDAEEPDPEHQLKYGKVFRIGDGEMPGDRFGCRCGMEILVEDDELDLSEE